MVNGAALTNAKHCGRMHFSQYKLIEQEFPFYPDSPFFIRRITHVILLSFVSSEALQRDEKKIKFESRSLAVKLLGVASNAA